MKRVLGIIGLSFFIVLSVFLYNECQYMKKCPNCSYDIGFDQMVNPDIHGTGYGYINADGSMFFKIEMQESKLTQFKTEMQESNEFGLTQGGSWAVRFDYGDIKGRALCSSTGQGFWGYYGRRGNPDENSVGSNCWCKMTEPAVSRWIFISSTARTDNCIDHCVSECSEDAAMFPLFRSRLFRTVKN